MTDDADLTSYDSIDMDKYLATVEHPDSWNNLYERPFLISKLPELKGKNVLDLGCCTGFFTEYALSREASVTAVDASRKSLERLASQVQSPKLTVQYTDISLPMHFLENQSFDLVICSLILHYIKDWDSLLEELHRTLKMGGRIYITTHHPFGIYLYLKPESYYDFKLVEDTWGNSENRFKVRYFMRPLTEVLRPLLRSKFRIETIEEMLPDESLRESHRELYARLKERPGFLYIELEKK